MNRFRLNFGSGNQRPSVFETTIHLPVPAPVLQGRAELDFRFPSGETTTSEHSAVFDSGAEVFGWLRGRTELALEASVKELYERMFRFAGARPLHRCWHFIPRINSEGNGLENYRRFCRARTEAFQRRFGEDWELHLPAASAVGTEQEAPVFLFACGKAVPERAENPEQVPAYRYPAIYGPCPPGFVRASRVKTGRELTTFISGTASIKRSETVFPGDCAKQTETTLDNLRLISRAIGTGGDLGLEQEAKRFFLIYLRRREDLPAVRQILENRLLAPGDASLYLLADICRSDLLVEIEATIRSARD